MAALRVCDLADLETDSATRFDVADLKVSVVRIGDDVYALGDTCSHANVSLSGGDVDSFDKTLECPKHGAAFSVVDGEPQCLPATKPVPIYDVEVREGTVFLIQESPDGVPAALCAAADKESSA